MSCIGINMENILSDSENAIRLSSFLMVKLKAKQVLPKFKG